MWHLEVMCTHIGASLHTREEAVEQIEVNFALAPIILRCQTVRKQYGRIPKPHCTLVEWP